MHHVYVFVISMHSVLRFSFRSFIMFFPVVNVQEELSCLHVDMLLFNIKSVYLINAYDMSHSICWITTGNKRPS